MEVLDVKQLCLQGMKWIDLKNGGNLVVELGKMTQFTKEFPNLTEVVRVHSPIEAVKPKNP